MTRRLRLHRCEDLAAADRRVEPIRCDEPGCDRAADTMHWLPYVIGATRIAYACPDHDPGGYWTRVDADGLPRQRDFVHHVAETKGAAALLVFVVRWEVERNRRDREFSAALDEIERAAGGGRT